MMRAVLRVSPARRAQTQSPHDVLDVEDRVVDDDPQRDHEARQGHRVDRGAGPEQHQPGREQRQRDSNDADDRSTPLVKEDRV